MSWVLVVILTVYYGHRAQIEMHDFDTLTACMDAATLIEKDAADSDNNITVVTHCTPKGVK